MNRLESRPASRLPELVTHTFHPRRGPFHNLCELPALEAGRWLDEMRAVGRCLRPGYLARRHATEERLRAERGAKLGPTPLRHPIYFFLGDFADGRDPARPCSIRLPLSALPARAITFTWGDSMSGGELLTLTELEARVEAEGLPPREWGFIELQLWDRAPLIALEAAP